MEVEHLTISVVEGRLVYKLCISFILIWLVRQGKETPDKKVVHSTVYGEPREKVSLEGWFEDKLSTGK